jgi:hypothetical protein
MIHSHSPEILHIMDMLGLPKHVHEFTLKVKHGEFAEIECSYFVEKANGAPSFDLTTKRYQLVEVGRGLF